MSAQDVVATLTASPTEPRQVLVSGGIGTGKTLLLSRIRDGLRAAGVPVLGRAPRDGDPAGAAYVVDDAQLLDDADLLRLADVIADGDATVVLAAEPLAQHPALTAAITAAGRQAPIVTLGPLAPAQIAAVAAELTGVTPPVELVRSVAAATAGLPFLVRPALAAGAAPDGEPPGTAIAAATRAVLVDRLRRVDDAVLDVLLVASLGAELGAEDVARALDVEVTHAHRLVDAARATGLLAPSLGPAFGRLLHRSLVHLVGATRHHDVEIGLLRAQVEADALSGELALRMADHGIRDARLGAALVRLAERQAAQPARAARLYRAAAAVGASIRDARLADALAASGDCAAAARLADGLLTSDDAAERAAAVRIGASVALHDGAAGQAADLVAWLGTPADDEGAAAAAIVALAVGDPAAARAAAAAESAGPPTSASRAARALSRGLVASLEADYPAVVSTLVPALAVPASTAAVAPDTPVALVALAALHGGDAARARSVLARAGDGTAFGAHRVALLRGWLRLQDGQLNAAATDLAAMSAAELHRRDALWANAIRTGIARRNGDSGALQQHWHAAMDVLSESTVELFGLLPLGELWIAAARLGQVDRVRPAVDEGFALLARLGDPSLWSVPLHWAGVHAGILANAPDAVAPHGQALSVAAGRSALARALARAGRAWLRVLANHVDVDEVTAAARGLVQFGLGWDATRLASQAALHTPDGRTSAAMLQLARDLKATVAAQDVSVGAGAGAAGSGRPDGSASGAGGAWGAVGRGGAAAGSGSGGSGSGGSGSGGSGSGGSSSGGLGSRGLGSGGSGAGGLGSGGAGSGGLGPGGLGSGGGPNWARLSDREREVAELVLQGMPYRDIGSQLLISAKTVEHHVARIRRRLGAESRSELLSMLRAILNTPA
ncbi:isoniazid response ATPase/transcriptional regulator IniR [Mycolicibacterium grossiae]|uniref:isoniazid response ATPase/transcriptional regulator IniR n=1 Tax=Mycolicibacterium grossiae TaxID=1552759 RepID=UPI0011F25848|nr:isoniazid response ATPase/transcriptional regulator IniR [Mycolicibacterium grossiae]QEM44862.1 helix-turn-helix transcriptional regulator [Mycolicibacterium grossiae]